MSSIFSRRRRKSHETPRPDDSRYLHGQDLQHVPEIDPGNKSGLVEQFQPQLGPPPGYSYYLSPEAAANAQYSATYATADDPGRAAHCSRQTGSSLGIAADTLLGSKSGGSPVLGTVEGQVAGIMIVQQVNQHQRHQYWREQSLNYRDQLPADRRAGAGGGLLPSSPTTNEGNRPRSRNEKRDEKRKARWERRAAGRNGRKADVSSGSDNSLNM